MRSLAAGVPSTSTVNIQAGRGQTQGALPSPQDSKLQGASDLVVAQRVFALSVKTNCLACHGQEKQENGLDMRQYQSFSKENWDKVMLRIDPKASDKFRMPKGLPALTPVEYDAFSKVRVSLGK
jgi:hypothetical protein